MRGIGTRSYGLPRELFRMRLFARDRHHGSLAFQSRREGQKASRMLLLQARCRAGRRPQATTLGLLRPLSAGSRKTDGRITPRQLSRPTPRRRSHRMQRGMPHASTSTLRASSFSFLHPEGSRGRHRFRPGFPSPKTSLLRGQGCPARLGRSKNRYGFRP